MHKWDLPIFFKVPYSLKAPWYNIFLTFVHFEISPSFPHFIFLANLKKENDKSFMFEVWKARNKNMFDLKKKKKKKKKKDFLCRILCVLYCVYLFIWWGISHDVKSKRVGLQCFSKQIWTFNLIPLGKVWNILSHSDGLNCHTNVLLRGSLLH